MTHPYFVEDFTSEERAILARFFTNVDRPVFALVNLPEEVKGALFARYSRTRKSLRRLFLDEFYRGEQVRAVSAIGSEKAEELYDRILVEYGDDSVAQLGGAHIAVEQASNILTKAIEWGRLGAYLEQSTRYVPYDDRPGGLWRYFLEPDIMASPHAERYRQTMDAIFEAYAGAIAPMTEHLERKFPRAPEDPERVWRTTIRAKAFDALRGMLPAATVSNLGIFASGQAYESMLTRLLASPLAEARACAERMHAELREVIPAFLQRVDRPDRGGRAVEYLRSTREQVARLADELVAGRRPDPHPAVTLVDWDPLGEDKLAAAALYSSSDLPQDQIRALVRRMGAEDRLRVIRAYVGERENRRHKPGRALERVSYRFDILSDYAAFRDLQRHRMLTVEWQNLTPCHGHAEPPEIDEADLAPVFRETMQRSADLWSVIHPSMPAQAQYAVCMAYRIRYVMQMNAREAMHLIELRSSPQGHASYRQIAQEMWRQIREVAGHKTVAEMMRFVDFSEVDLERLEAERRAERRRGPAIDPVN